MNKSLTHTFTCVHNTFVVTFENATSADIEELEQVHRFGRVTGDGNITPDYALARFTNPVYYEAWGENLLNGEKAVLKATCNGSIVGFAVGGGADEGEGYDELNDQYPNLGELHQIYIVSGFQRSGVGTALYSALMGDMRDMGYQSIAINMLTGNEPAKQFYEKMGAKKTHEITEIKTSEPVPEPIEITCDLMVQEL